ncbi:Multidrug efflux pump subunit AcrA (membrane-fusion protein) [Mariniphaga anaerophila]|uniref:Multidrug efflux pump subunit AcrA (Membrane-fusion protein) n=1 Tax=Mariniphaga anaerophila TaxID=1484053 RepID=A0A1M4YL10_9BACT|nr:efflux RND transporter periplasmic adaptor subunit [Mariniphaga anaerophila]SHF06212.1 Multidrug efflux pump subunit AcrA (membrane-fusion protein) [Mariniphaga anaerophila]
MKLKRKQYLIIIAAAAVVVTALTFFLTSGEGGKQYTVKNGLFELVLEVKGEIQGKNAVVISLPDELKRRDLRIYQMKIKDMVEEGTSVKAGDWVATLDAAQITQEMQNNQQDLDKQRAELNDARIDSSIQLTKLREELGEFKYDLEYKELELEQSQYESPAYQRKKQMEYDQTVRQMKKKQRDYQLRQLDLKMKTKRIEDRFDFHSNRDSLLKAAMMAARVTAPKDGLVMYAKLWNGRKLRVGDDISIWMPTIATLPDLSEPVSEAYIPEIDITKIALGDSVRITIDALPGDDFKGVVSNIANVGQELSGFDMKVFKVMIDLKVEGKKIKPAMTSNNKIVLARLTDVIKIPRSCLFTDNGSTYVFLNKSGKIWKKKVTPGLENEEEVVIETGLESGDKILMNPPEGGESIDFLNS